MPERRLFGSYLPKVMLHSQTSRKPGSAQSAPQSVTLSDQLAEHLRHSDNARKARLMLRSWFLSQVLQSDTPTTANPGSVESNVYLYEMLDDFLSELVENPVAA